VYRGEYEEGLRLFRAVPPQSNQSLWNYQVAWRSSTSAGTRRLSAYGALPAGPSGGSRRRRDEHARHPVRKAGDAGRAQADIQTAIQKGKRFIHFHHTAYNIASVYALLNEPGRAVYWLRRTAESRWPCYPYFARDPISTTSGRIPTSSPSCGS